MGFKLMTRDEILTDLARIEMDESVTLPAEEYKAILELMLILLDLIKI